MFSFQKLSGPQSIQAKRRLDTKQQSSLEEHWGTSTESCFCAKTAVSRVRT